jgi:hypothetical protein
MYLYSTTPAYPVVNPLMSESKLVSPTMHITKAKRVRARPPFLRTISIMDPLRQRTLNIEMIDQRMYLKDSSDICIKK